MVCTEQFESTELELTQERNNNGMLWKKYCFLFHQIVKAQWSILSLLNCRN